MLHKSESIYGVVTPVILAGGHGRRLWPLSRPAHPKPFLRPLGGCSLLQKTLGRVQKFSSLWMVGHEDHADKMLRQAQGVGLKPACLIAEPAAMNTGPAIAAACFAAQKSSVAYLLFLPSDHKIKDMNAMWQAVQVGLSRADTDIVIFGIKPRYAATRYGYIACGEALSEGETAPHKVDGFKEKPEKNAAQNYLREGGYLWNSGIFLCKPDVMLSALKKHCPEMYEACEKAVMNAQKNQKMLHLNEPDFKSAPKISIDYAVIEHAENLSVVPVDLRWLDLGTWPSYLGGLCR